METYKNTPEKFDEKSEILKALAHPIRLCIVKNLLEIGECNVSNMQHCLEAPQSTISQHLTKLKNAKIITGKKKKLEVFYSVTNEEVKKIIKIMFNS